MRQHDPFGVRAPRGRHGPRKHLHHHDRDHGGRMRHGDVRASILLALGEGPAHGYEIGQRLLRISGGAWQPSPGSIYHTLQTLADEDLVTSEERDGKRIYTISKRGLDEMAERQKRNAEAPWQAARDGKAGELREAVVGLNMAAKQLGTVGSLEQRKRATEIILDARKKLYELLANG